MKRKASSRQEQQGEPGDLFHGLRVVFLLKRHQQRLIQLIKDKGGVVEDAINPLNPPTHIVCTQDSELLDISRQLSEAVPVGDAPQASEKQTLLLDGNYIVLPSTHSLQIVIPEFFSASILKRQLQDEDNYRPLCYANAVRAAELLAAEALHAQQSVDQAQSIDSTETVPLGVEEWRIARQGLDDEGEGEEINEQHMKQQQQQQQEGVPCIVQRQGSNWVAIQGTLPQFTGGHTGIPWGSFGVWDEPYAETAAQETVDRLKTTWYHSQSHSGISVPPSLERENGGGSSRPQLNDICIHAVCAKRPYCLLEKLAEGKKAYVEGTKEAYFKSRAIDKALHELSSYPFPLDSVQDVDAVGLGTKTTTKLKEILGTGELSGVLGAEARLAADPKAQALQLFQQVWGVGPGVADKWWSAGCRSLEEVEEKMKGKLSEQQKVGLEYFEDLAVRIPRSETERAEQYIRKKVFEAVEARGSTDAEFTYCYVTGSYRRGAPTSSDIDILICLPPSLRETDAAEFLHELLVTLLDEGFLLDGMNPRQPPHKQSSGEASSWMGLCKPEGSQHIRRIDIKVYGSTHTPFAVNYFANSMSFCRATRYWANQAKAQACKYYPAATGFRLSDKELVPIAKSSKQQSGLPSSPPGNHSSGGGSRHRRKSTAEGGIQILGPAIPCTSETDIFEALGLNFVPVTMRFFSEFY